MRYEEYLRSEQWAQLKVDIILIRGCKCQRCGKSNKPNKLHIHHKTYKNLFNEKPEDLEILCAKCHMNEHGLLHKKSKKPKVKKKPQKKNIWQIVSEAKRNKNPNSKKWGTMYRKASKA